MAKHGPASELGLDANGDIGNEDLVAPNCRVEAVTKAHISLTE
jgi:hypothetical protein